jgi:hypothetical protein
MLILTKWCEIGYGSQQPELEPQFEHGKLDALITIGVYAALVPLSHAYENCKNIKIYKKFKHRQESVYLYKTVRT